MRSVALAALLVAAAPAAHAALINVSVYLNESTLAENATIANRPARPADLTFGLNSSANFDNRIAPGTGNSATTTINQFLATGGVGPVAGGDALLNNSYWFFTGSIVLQPGDNMFTITHDDGFELDILGLGAGPEVSVPDPTGPTPTTYTITNPNSTPTQYSFEFSYGECCGGPAVISVQGGQLVETPAPATIALFGLGVAALGFGVRRRG